jgi:hypothetical protein
MEGWTIFDVMREIIFWTSPVVFLMGIILLAFSKYNNLEMYLGREFGLRKRVIPKLEQNVYSFHEWCLKKHALIGLVCIIYAVVMFLFLKKFSGETIGDVY